MQKKTLTKEELLNNCHTGARKIGAAVMIVLCLIGIVLSWMILLRGGGPVSAGIFGTIFMMSFIGIVSFMLIREGNQLVKWILNNEFKIYEESVSDKKKRIGSRRMHYRLFFDQIEIRLFGKEKGVEVTPAQFKEAQIGEKYYLVCIGNRKWIDFVFPVSQYDLSPELQLHIAN